MIKVIKVCTVVLMYPIIAALVLMLFGIDGTKRMVNKKSV